MKDVDHGKSNLKKHAIDDLKYIHPLHGEMVFNVATVEDYIDSIGRNIYLIGTPEELTMKEIAFKYSIGDNETVETNISIKKKANASRTKKTGTLRFFKIDPTGNFNDNGETLYKPNLIFVVK